MLQPSECFADSAAFEIAMYGRSVLPRNTQSQAIDIEGIAVRKDQQVMITRAMPMSECP